MILAVKGD